MSCSPGLRSIPEGSPFEESIPRRMLGKTGVQVSVLAFGCGSVFLNGYPSDEAALEALECALHAGINYFDTAHSYGNGESERRLGLFLKEHRRDVFVATKIGARDADNFMRQCELSLKRLQTDHVDLMHIHGLDSFAELSQLAARGGIYDCLVKLQDQKVAKFIGFSCHANGQLAANAIEQFDFDCCMIQLNAAGTGGFEKTALPAAIKKNMGILAMKSTAQGYLLANAPEGRLEALLDYVWRLPVSSIVLGMPKIEMLRQDVGLSKNIKQQDESGLRTLRDEMANDTAFLEEYFQHHSDITFI